MSESFMEMSKRLDAERAARAKACKEMFFSLDMEQRKANGEPYAYDNENGGQTVVIPGEQQNAGQSYEESSQNQYGSEYSDGSYTAPQEYEDYYTENYVKTDSNTDYSDGYSEPEELLDSLQQAPEYEVQAQPPAAASQTQQEQPQTQQRGERVESITLGNMSEQQKSFPKVFYRLLSATPKLRRKWLIKKWLPKGPCVGLLYGASGCGKTTLGLYWGVIIAYGFTMWKGYSIHGSPQSRRVFYICSEGEQDIWLRIRAILYFLRLPENALDGKLFILDGDKYFSDEISGISNHYLSNPEACKLLQNDIADIVGDGCSADLIIIDTFNGFFGEEEAANDKIGKFINNLKNYLARPFDANVMIIHHVNLESTFRTASEILPRGGSANFSDTDYAIACATRNGPERGIEIFLRKQKIGKQNFFEYVQATNVILPPEIWPSDDDGEYATALVIDDRVTSDEARENILHQYKPQKENGEKTKKENAEKNKLQLLSFIENGAISAEQIDCGEEAYKITHEQMEKALLLMQKTKDKISTELKPYDFEKSDKDNRGACARLQKYGYLDIQKKGKKGNKTFYEYVLYPKRNNSDKE